MDIRILGPIEVRHDGTPMVLRGAKPRELLTLFATRPNRAVSASELVDALWEGEPPRTAAAALRVYVGKVRDVLDVGGGRTGPSSRLPLGPHGYLLRAEVDEIDFGRFERFIVLGREANLDGDPRRAIRLLVDALDLWRGEPLCDAAHLEVMRGLVTRIHDLRVTAVEELADARLSVGDHELVTGLLAETLAAHPLREQLAARLMVALYRSGRQPEALEVFRRLERDLDEHGLETSAELRRIEEDVLLRRPTLDRSAPSGRVDTRQSRPAPRRFIGRRAELAQLVAATDAAMAGQRRLVLINGEPGVGKSTLADEYRRWMATRGVTVLKGSCTARPAVSYEPLVEAFKDAALVGLEPDPRTGGPVDLSGAGSGGRVPVGQISNDGAQIRRYRFFESLAEIIDRVASSPVVLLIEDLHWADRPTLLALRHLSRYRSERGFVLVATMRGDEIGGARADTIDTLAARSLRGTICLDGFNDSEVRALIRAEAPPEALDELLRTAPTLRSLTAGNPLYLRELLYDIDDETIKIDELVSTRPGLAIAPSGCSTLRERFDQLAEPARMILRAAAVLAKPATPDTLLSVSGQAPADDMFEAIEECLAARLLIDDPSRVGHYGFSHEIFRHAVSTYTDPDETAALHLRAAQLARSTESVSLTEVAHHLLAAGNLADPTDTGAYAEAAGNEAMQCFAWSEAARWFQVAIAYCDDLAAETAKLYLVLGRALERDQQLDQAQEALIRGAELARHDDRALLGEIALALDGPWSSGTPIQGIARGYLEEAIASVAVDDVQRRVVLLNGLASNLYYSDPAREAAAAAEAMALTERHPDSPSRAVAELALHRSLTHQPEMRHERLRLASEALARLAEAAGMNEFRLRVQREFLADLLENGMIDDFDRQLDDYDTEASETGSPRDLYWAAALRATSATLRGELGVAEQLARGAERRGRELEQNSIGAYMLHQFMIRYQQGRLAEQLPTLRNAATADTVFWAGACLAATALAETGHHTSARKMIADVIGDDARGLPKDVFWLAAMVMFGGVAATIGDAKMCVAIAEEVTDCADHVVVFGTGGAILGPTHLWLAKMFAAAGDLTASLEHAHAGLTSAQALRAPYWIAEGHLSHAHALGTSAAVRRTVQEHHHEASLIAARHGFGRITARLAATQ